MEEDCVNVESAFVTDQIQLLCLKTYESSMYITLHNNIIILYIIQCDVIYLHHVYVVYACDLSLMCIHCVGEQSYVLWRSL